jgi:hypothetical protein
MFCIRIISFVRRMQAFHAPGAAVQVQTPAWLAADVFEGHEIKCFCNNTLIVFFFLWQAFQTCCERFFQHPVDVLSVSTAGKKTQEGDIHTACILYIKPRLTEW